MSQHISINYLKMSNERIVLEVDGNTAKAWRNSPPDFKLQVEKEINFQLKRRLKEVQLAEFKKTVDQVRDEASKNGLTEEILNQILNEEEEDYL